MNGNDPAGGDALIQGTEVARGITVRTPAAALSPGGIHQENPSHPGLTGLADSADSSLAEWARGLPYRNREALSHGATWTGRGEEVQPGDPGRIGPFLVVRRLGSGGMGRVFLCLSAGGRPVAVKLIRADLAADREFRTRFRREMQAARKVSGLYTALLVEADVDGPVPWLATAYVPGPPLADAVRDHGPLPPAPVLALAAGLAESLAAIHAAGVVHRDLKPSNILLAQDGPRVIDFGISRAADASVLTTAGLIIGSPGFMSPEQADGGQVGPPSDVFSLGAVLAFAATGRSPFGTGSTPALLYRVVHAAPALDGIPAEVRDLAGRCLAKDPGDRPTAAGLLAGLSDAGITTGWPAAPAARPSPPAGPEPAGTTAGDAAFTATVTHVPGDYRGQSLPPRPAPIAAFAPGKRSRPCGRVWVRAGHTQRRRS